MMRALFQDFRANKERPHIQLILLLFRLSQVLRRSGNPVIRVACGVPATAAYRLVSLVGFGIDIPTSTRVGPALSIHHGMGLVVHSRSVIGAGVTLRHCTTLGSKRDQNAPILGDNVDVGPNTCIIGGVHVGAGALIGAGSVVVRDVNEFTVVAGNPARKIGECV